MRALALVTDGFGGQGGIARYNEAFLRALARVDHVEEVVVVPRFGQADAVDLPARLRQLPPTSSKAAYIARVFGIAARRPRFDLLFCGHINVAPLAAALAHMLHCRWWLQIHGVDAWDPPGRLVRTAVAGADLVTSVSRYTRRRFLAWADLEPHKVRVLPNTVEPRFTPGPKPAHLARRYGLTGKRVLLSVGRISARERYKGHDRVIAAMPRLRARFADLVYVVAGDGDDRPRLEALAREQRVSDIVRFVGWVPDQELVAHYRMADLFVMPSTGEGFGIAFLEAMACGVRAIGGDADGSLDPLRDGVLGPVVPVDHATQEITALLDRTPLWSGTRLAETVHRVFGREAFTRQVEALVGRFAVGNH